MLVSRIDRVLRDPIGGSIAMVVGALLIAIGAYGWGYDRGTAAAERTAKAHAAEIVEQ